MKFRTRSRPTESQPGIAGTARTERTPQRLRAALAAGDVVFLEYLDMDRNTAQRLIDAGVVAVVNAQPMISGRYPNLGPQLLAEAGVVMVDGAGPASAVKDGTQVRVHGGEVFVGDDLVMGGRVVDEQVLADELASARSGLSTQLTSFTHNSTEFLRREEALLLHGEGIPTLDPAHHERPAVVVVASHDWASELRGLRPFLREQHPVVIAVDQAADAMRSAKVSPDVVVLSAPDGDLPSREALRRAEHVVVLVERGAGRNVTEPLERMGVAPVRFETSATGEDAALLIADAAQARVVVGVGMHATLDEFLDRQRAGLASTYLTRLKLGPRLVDAAAVPTLYDGAVRPRHVAALGIVGTLLMAVAVYVTPVGQEWAADLAPWFGDIYDNVRGLFT